MPDSNEQTTDFYLNDICGHADTVYRFCYLVTLSHAAAIKATKAVFHQAIDEIDVLKRKADPLGRMLTKAWQDTQSNTNQIEAEGVLSFLAEFSPQQRALFGLQEVFGYKGRYTSEIIGEIRFDDLILVRGKLAKVEKVDDKQTNHFLAAVDDYLDDDLNEAAKKLFDEALTQVEFQEYLEVYKIQRGTLQAHMQNMGAGDELIQELHEFLIPKEVMEAQEADTISLLNRREKNYSMLYKGGFAAAFLIAGFYIFAYFNESLKPFKPLDVVAFESIRLAERPLRERLSMPSHNVQEVLEFFAAHKHMEFEPFILDKLLRKGFHLEGGSLLDYDATQVALVAYRNKKSGEKVFHYMCDSDRVELPSSDSNRSTSGVEYQVFGSDRVNILAWAQGETTSLLVGWSASDRLAQVF